MIDHNNDDDYNENDNGDLMKNIYIILPVLNSIFQPFKERSKKILYPVSES